jgi:hypothetical protein
MRTLPILALLFLALPAFAADWPQRGDTVFVAARLEQRIPGMLVAVGGAFVMSPPVDSDLGICAPLVRSWSASRFKDASARLHILAGDWTPYLKRTRGECRAAIAANGLPSVVSKGVRHEVAQLAH